MNDYYFGCWSPEHIGHYLYNREGRLIRPRQADNLPIDPMALDASLLFGVLDVPGNAVVFRGRDYTILSFWDRSGDHRPGSNSAFILKGDLLLPSAIATAKAVFPQRWSLITFSLIEHQPQSAKETR